MQSVKHSSEDRIQHIHGALVNCLRSPEIKNIINEGVASLEGKLQAHNDGACKLSEQELADCWHDLVLLNGLGAG